MLWLILRLTVKINAQIKVNHIIKYIIIDAFKHAWWSKVNVVLIAKGHRIRIKRVTHELLLPICSHCYSRTAHLDQYESCSSVPLPDGIPQSRIIWWKKIVWGMPMVTLKLLDSPNFHIKGNLKVFGSA